MSTLIISAMSACPTISWRLLSSNRSVDVPAKVPGVAHLALMDAGILKGDPFYRCFFPPLDRLSPHA